MVKRFLNEWSFQKRSLGLYLAFSCLAAAIILMTAIDSGDHIVHQLMTNPLALSFLALNGYVFLCLTPYVGMIGPDPSLLAFFLAQFVILQTIGLNQGRVEYFYLSTMPMVALLFGIQSDWRSSPRFKLRMATITMGLGGFTFLSFLMHPRFDEHWPVSALLLGAFCLWQFGTIYLANIEWMRMSRETLVSFMRNKSKTEGEFFLHPAEKERFFFHDMINHTHGMSLLLRYRLMKNRGLTYEESLGFSRELEALQALVQEHFGFTHKNLHAGETEWRSFNELKNLTFNLVQAYFPDRQTEAFYLFKGSLAEEFNLDPELPFVAYHRIVTNIIKNCSEAGSRHIEIVFEGSQSELTLTVKNDVYKNHASGYDLGKTLEKIISHNSEKNFSSGLGLESIESLSRAHGGHFHFFIEDGHWVSQVCLPFRGRLDWEDSKLLESHKKKAA